MPQNLPVSRCGTFAESLRKSVSGLSRSVANSSYWVRISSAGRPRRELNYLEYHPTTFWRTRGNSGTDREFPVLNKFAVCPRISAEFYVFLNLFAPSRYTLLNHHQ